MEKGEYEKETRTAILAGDLNANSTYRNDASTIAARIRPIHVFAVLWTIIFLLYYPAAHGGWVSDTVEALQKLKHGTFKDFITVVESRGNMYPLTQSATYVFYKLFGVHPWLWHLLFITLQSTIATLLFFICSKLFSDSAIKNGNLLAAGGVLLFCICPHLSEVMVWKVSYHYMQAMLLLLAVVYCVQKYLDTGLTKFAWYSALFYLLSTFSDEFYFLTPVFALTLIVYYRFGLGCSKTLFRKALLYFLLPVLSIIFLHLLTGIYTAGSYAANLGDEANQPVTEYLRKPPLYLFHIVFLGRFFSDAARQSVYDAAGSIASLALVYGSLACIAIYVIARFRKFSPAAKAAVLFLCWMLTAAAIVCPVWFPQILLVNFDRYTYFMLPPLYMLLMLLLGSIRSADLAISIFIVYASINIIATLRVNKYWKESARVVDKIIHTVPPVDNKIVLLLNVPGNMRGVPMIGPFLHFSFRQMHNLFNERQINNPMYDVVGYNMSGPGDGAHVNVYNDSLLHVTLNQWGTWWWRGMWGASSYENENYRVNMTDMGHWYELVLKRPASEYILLYQVGDQWKVVDWNKKNDDQN